MKTRPKTSTIKCVNRGHRNQAFHFMFFLAHHTHRCFARRARARGPPLSCSIVRPMLHRTCCTAFSTSLVIACPELVNIGAMLCACILPFISSMAKHTNSGNKQRHCINGCIVYTTVFTRKETVRELCRTHMPPPELDRVIHDQYESRRGCCRVH